MKKSEILKTNGKIRVKITMEESYPILFSTINGWQWTSNGLTPGLAKLTIEALQEYLERYHD